MADPVELAKTARTHLASALAALQSNAHVPEELLELAEPIAESMGILHQVERSKGAVLDRRDVALTNVRTVLDRLQRVGTNHPAVDVVTECVAASLSRVHTLSRYEPPAAGPPQDPFARTEPVARQSPFTQPQMAPPPAPPPPPGYAPAPVAAHPLTHTQPIAPSPVAAQPAPAMHTQPIAPSPIAAHPAYAAPAPAAQAPYVAPAPAQQAPQAALHLPPQRGAAPQEQPAPQAQPEPQRPPEPAGAIHVDVELGTHSDSNFYKGLGGNDVIEHGGIFVATYKIPKLGTPVVLRVLLPGDYEFHANAVVQWARESDGGSDAPPGFGARVTHISAEGKQLVYRYTRNREPIFYDDL